jgi:hypothetical protein
MSLKALPNIFKMLKIDMVESSNYSNYSQCIVEAFELLNNTKLTLKPEHFKAKSDVYGFKNFGSSYVRILYSKAVHVVMDELEDTSRKLNWIYPFKDDGKYLSTDTYPNLQCYTVTNKESLNLIKLALMKARIKFEVSSKYIIGKDCAFMAFKNEANEIKLIFDAN